MGHNLEDKTGMINLTGILWRSSLCSMLLLTLQALQSGWRALLVSVIATELFRIFLHHTSERRG